MSINTDYSYYNNSYYTQQASIRQKPSLTSLMDTDEDKKLSADELSDFAADFNAKTGNALDLSSIMSAYDSNGDGALDESEQEAMNKEKALEKLMASGMQNRQMRMIDGPPQPFSSDIDQDGDGSWSSDKLTEFIGMVNEATGSDYTSEDILTKYDTDGDGSLSRSEQAEMMKAIAPPPPKSSTISSVDEDEEILKKIEELRKLMEEKVTKKEEEKTETEDSVTKAEALKRAFQKRLSHRVGAYEKSFWFENASDENVKYGA